MNFKLLLAIVFGLVALILGYRSGAPLEACDSMTPHHGVQPQSVRAPYNFVVSRNSINPGDEVNFTINGYTARDTIKGFMVQARQGNQRVGHFKVEPRNDYVQGLDCGGVKNSAVTHKEHIRDKKSITLTWVSPKDFEGKIVFRNTVALNYGVFWVGEKSKPVESIKIVPTPTTSITNLPPQPTSLPNFT